MTLKMNINKEKISKIKNKKNIDQLESLNAKLMLDSAEKDLKIESIGNTNARILLELAKIKSK